MNFMIEKKTMHKKVAKPQNSSISHFLSSEQVVCA